MRRPNETYPRLTLMMARPLLIACLLVFVMALSACYHDRSKSNDALAYNDKEQADSVSFMGNHHYARNYNFVVKSDSLSLLVQQPEEFLSDMMIDSITVFHHDHVVVVDIRVIPTDPTDTVWVQVAKDQSTFGWVRESELLSSVVPSDPISQFISVFSDTHLLIFLIIISLIAAAYLTRVIFKRNAKIVHFNDISSFYPTLLALIVASSATFYSSIQLFAPEAWRHFYYHPTLNPFVVPPILSVFLVSVWAILIVAIAAIDVTRKMLPTGEAILYLCGLAGVCAVNYIVFSIGTLYYVGYPLLVAYVLLAIRRYVRHFRGAYLCGNCGSPLVRKGACPKCGRVNI